MTANDYDAIVSVDDKTNVTEGPAELYDIVHIARPHAASLDDCMPQLMTAATESLVDRSLFTGRSLMHHDK